MQGLRVELANGNCNTLLAVCGPDSCRCNAHPMAVPSSLACTYLVNANACPDATVQQLPARTVDLEKQHKTHNVTLIRQSRFHVKAMGQKTRRVCCTGKWLPCQRQSGDMRHCGQRMLPSTTVRGTARAPDCCTTVIPNALVAHLPACWCCEHLGRPVDAHQRQIQQASPL